MTVSMSVSMSVSVSPSPCAFEVATQHSWIVFRPFTHTHTQGHYANTRVRTRAFAFTPTLIRTRTHTHAPTCTHSRAHTHTHALMQAAAPPPQYARACTRLHEHVKRARRWRCPRKANLMIVAPDHRNLAWLRDGLEDFVRLAGTPDEILQDKTLLCQRRAVGLAPVIHTCHACYGHFSQGRSLPHASSSNSPGPGTNHPILPTFSTTDTRASIIRINNLSHATCGVETWCDDPNTSQCTTTPPYCSYASSNSCLQSSQKASHQSMRTHQSVRCVVGRVDGRLKPEVTAKVTSATRNEETGTA